LVWRNYSDCKNIQIIAGRIEPVSQKKEVSAGGGNLFHYGIIMVFVGHFVGLFTPERLYHLIMTTDTKRALALTLGSIFGTAAVIGITILLIRRLRDGAAQNKR